MALDRLTFSDISEFDSLNLEDAPSLDIRHLITKRVLVPKVGSSYMLFFTEIDSSYRPENGCPYCNSSNLRLYGKASKPRIIHDVVRNNMRVDIAYYPPKMQCCDCMAVFTVTIPGFTERSMTKRLEDFIRKECFLSSFDTIAVRSGVSIGTIENIIDEEIDKYEAMRAKESTVAPRVLGMDEKHVAKKERGTLVDIEKSRLLEMFPDNKKKTMIKGIKALVDWDKNIEVVTVDMNSSYTKWLPELLPNATIVIDHYHVIQDLERRISTCRKAIIASIKKRIKQIEDPVERASLNSKLTTAIQSPRLFHYSMARLTSEQCEDRVKARSEIIKVFPEFKLLHNLIYSIEHMYTLEDRESAEEVWKTWVGLLPPAGKKQYEAWCKSENFDTDCFEAFKSFSRPGFQQYAPYILNYFNSPSTRFTNAATEGFNRAISTIITCGSGYSFRHLRGKCLYGHLVKEKIIYGVAKEVIKQAAKDTSFGWFNPGDYGKRKQFQPEGGKDRIVYHFTEFKSGVHLPEIDLSGDNKMFLSTLTSDTELIKRELARWENEGPYGSPDWDDEDLYEAL